MAKRNKGNKYGLGRKKSKEEIEAIVKSKKGKKRPTFSKEWRENMGRAISKRQVGSNNPAWKGGISTPNNLIRHSVEYRLWREAVYKRDNWTCQKYGIVGNRLVAHHIKNFSKYPELRFSIDNGITLSRKAHEQFHKKYGKRNNNREQLIEFLNN